MLAFFRKYQRSLYIFITIVIVISFSFFGTYSALTTSPIREQVVMHTIEGDPITRGELEEFSLFLGSDNEDKLIYGGQWGPNFLNDGVVKQDILQTGLAEILVKEYRSEMQADLQNRLEKEKKARLYVHPAAPFISVEGVWKYFAPQIKDQWDALQQTSDASSEEGFKARAALYLSQRQLPPPLLRQFLKYQEQQFEWLNPDQKLPYTDFSLFGYHSLEDWFGPKFTRLIAAFIINAAQIAESRGYRVTKEEAMADLFRNAEISFNQQKENPLLGVRNVNEYFREQIRRMGLDANRAAKLWQQVLLFRRLFQECGNSNFITPAIYQPFTDFVSEEASGEKYSLPEGVQLRNFQMLQTFEAYLKTVAKRSKEDDVLNLPTNFLSAEEVAKIAPELVYKRYRLEIAKVDKRSLQSKVSLRDTWNWEVEDKNWESLKEKFPLLGLKQAEDRSERLAALDTLDEATRLKVDTLARSSVVDSHPEWLANALEKANTENQVVDIYLQGDSAPFGILPQPSKLVALLDQNEKEIHYSPDDFNHYRLRVLEAISHYDVTTFDQAMEKKAMEGILNQQLQKFYATIREADPKTFKNEQGEWFPLNEVQNLVAEKYFHKLIQALRKVAAETTKTEGAELKLDELAHWRFYSYSNQEKERLAKGGLPEQPIKPIEKNLAAGMPLDTQWQLTPTPFKIKRGDPSKPHFNPSILLMLPKDTWSDVFVSSEGEVSFYKILEKGIGESAQGTNKRMEQLKHLVSNEAKQLLMRSVLNEINEKGSLMIAPIQSIEREEEI